MSEEKIKWICAVECLICGSQKLTGYVDDPEVGNILREYCRCCGELTNAVVFDYAPMDVALNCLKIKEIEHESLH